jgi:glycosyltransferase involved in cell wall biosynthesis
MRVLVFAPDSAGHHSNYLRLLLPAVLKLSSDVTVVTVRDARGSPKFESQLEVVADPAQVEYTIPHLSGSLIRQGRMRLRCLAEAVAQFRPDHVLVPSADHLTQVMGLRPSIGRTSLNRGVQMEGLMMRGGFAYVRPGWRQRVQDRLSLAAVERAPWTILHYVDPIPYEMLRRRGGSIAGRLRLMPDPVDLPPPVDPTAARRRLGVPEYGRYVGSVGIMDRRKGIDLLIRAFADAQLERDDRLLLVGQSSAEVRELLCEQMAELVRQNRIISIDRHVHDDALQDAVAAMDVVCTPYPRHIGSASIVIRAAAAERPILASTFGWMGMVVPHFSLGYTCNVLDTREFAFAIRAALEGSSEFRPSEAAPRFVAYHSVENFQAKWTARLRERLGLARGEGERNWSWVLAAAEDLAAGRHS